MELDQLAAFIAVAQHGSFSQAAEQLHLTQPAVSKRIAQLEDQLDARLFDRIGRRIALTEAGRALLPRARRLLNDAAEIRRALDDISGEVRGRLVMGTSHHIGLHRLPEPLKRFTRAHPEVELDIRFMDSEAACHAVEIGDLELAIVTLPPEPLPRLHTRPIWDDPLYFMVAREHPLATRRQVTLKELLDYPAVLPGTNTYTRGILERAVHEAGLRLRTGMETNYLETLRMLAEAGLGWSLLPATQLTDQLVALDVPDLALHRSLGAVTHARRSLSNAARAMVEVCRN
ncbi:MAG: LysR family transcriptional regulator [Gammaproteobacteria bacterium]|nr:MAG: LysR family transcriptional regulator [Gammaproteobacteria bacterium]